MKIVKPEDILKKKNESLKFKKEVEKLTEKINEKIETYSSLLCDYGKLYFEMDNNNFCFYSENVIKNVQSLFREAGWNFSYKMNKHEELLQNSLTHKESWGVVTPQTKIINTIEFTIESDLLKSSTFPQYIGEEQ